MAGTSRMPPSPRFSKSPSVEKMQSSSCRIPCSLSRNSAPPTGQPLNVSCHPLPATSHLALGLPDSRQLYGARRREPGPLVRSDSHELQPCALLGTMPNHRDRGQVMVEKG